MFPAEQPVHSGGRRHGLAPPGGPTRGTVIPAALPALADVTVNGHVHPGGMYADTVTVTLDGPALANYYYEYQVEVVGRNGNTPLNVYDAQNPEFMEWLFAQ